MLRKINIQGESDDLVYIEDFTNEKPKFLAEIGCYDTDILLIALTPDNEVANIITSLRNDGWRSIVVGDTSIKHEVSERPGYFGDLGLNIYLPVGTKVTIFDNETKELKEELIIKI